MSRTQVWPPSRTAGSRIAALFLCLSLAFELGASPTLPRFDFTDSAVVSEWTPAHDVSVLLSTTAGMQTTITGSDPYLLGPARDFPPGQLLWLRLRLRAAQAGTCQVFYFRSTPAEVYSVRFPVEADPWTTGRVPLPALGPGYRIRIDPPGTSGDVVLADLSFEPRDVWPSLDLTTQPAASQWNPTHDLRGLERSPEGLTALIGGADPYLTYTGPSFDLPSTQLLWLIVRLKSEVGGMAQAFYFRDAPSEAQSVRFPVSAGEWHEAKLPLPALGPGYRLRLDPPGASGRCTIASLSFQPRTVVEPPVWPKPIPPFLDPAAPRIESGPVQLRHASNQWGGFEVWVADQRMAVGHTVPLVGSVSHGAVKWESPTAAGRTDITSLGKSLSATLRWTDADLANWTVRQVFRPSQVQGAIEVDTEVGVDQDREVVYLPVLQLFAGVATFGTNKSQGLFAGVEYLENEPSSSEADLIGPAARRQVPLSYKVTFPLMSVCASNRYVGLVWEPHPALSALFDSPDRVFGSGAHAMGLILPGASAEDREDGNLMPYRGLTLVARQPMSFRATIIGGLNNTVVGATKAYVALRGLPNAPDPGRSATEFCETAAHGWLDSAIRATNRFRHATGSSFTPAPSADAALYLDWLQPQVREPGLAARLAPAASGALSQVGSADRNAAQIGHVPFPSPALVYGAVAENMAQAKTRCQAWLGRFQPDGTVLYSSVPGGIDYARTHWARHANGLTAQVVAGALKEACFAGDRALIERSLERLRGLAQYRDSVPRGAQTWEIPLHTPDILAAAHLVRAYTLGYELSGDAAFLEAAKNWAWSGLPFVYLHPPTARTVGLYATIPVLGATGFVAPVWIGLPVQWCGLVYADALYWLARVDPEGPWRQVADGITASGIQQSYPRAETDFAGLLPDSYDVQAGMRNGPNINPATLLACSFRLYSLSPVYDLQFFPHHGVWVHASGAIVDAREASDRLSFQVKGWSRSPYYVLIQGVGAMPEVLLNGQPLSLSFPHHYLSGAGSVVIQVEGEPSIEVRHRAWTALSIERTLGGDGVRLRWTSTKLLLQTADRLEGPAWQNVGGPHHVENGLPFLDLPVDAPYQFFRLRNAD